MAKPFGSEITILIIFLCAILCTFITLNVLYQLSIIPQKKNTNQRVNVLIIVCITATTLCEHCDLIRWLICFILNQSEVIYPLNQIMSIADFLYFAATNLFHSLALYRIHKAFKDTIYKIHFLQIIFFVFLIFVQSMIAFYYCIIVAMQPLNDPNAFFLKYNSMPIVILMVNDFILNTFLLILFVCKLRSALTDILISSSIEIIGASTDNVSFNMTDLMTRHCILFGVAIVSNQLFFFANFCVFSSVGYEQIKLHFITFCFRSFENAAKCVVLYLGLQQNRNKYNKICNQCHQKLKKCVVWNMQNNINRRQTKYQLMQIDESMN